MSDPDLQIRGGGPGRTDPEITGGGAVWENFFRPFGPRFGLKMRGSPWGKFLLFCVPQRVKTKETYPTRPGSPTPCKQALRQQFCVVVVHKRQRNVQIKCDARAKLLFCFINLLSFKKQYNKHTDHSPTQEGWQILVVSNVLHHSTDDFSRFLEDFLSVPSRVYLL